MKTNILKKTLLFLKFSRTRNSPFCQIEDVDLSKNIVVIHCRGIDAPITLSFHEIINDPVLLSNFSSIHAAWIGYYYGKYYKELIKEKGNYSVPFSLSSNPAHEKNCILMLTRQGNLVYLNHATNVAHTAHPTRIMANMNLIIRFEPMQACYIGILSGLYKEKKVISRSSVQLTLVK